VQVEHQVLNIANIRLSISFVPTIGMIIMLDFLKDAAGIPGIPQQSMLGTVTKATELSLAVQIVTCILYERNRAQKSPKVGNIITGTSKL
jgi:hypothetical protein